MKSKYGMMNLNHQSSRIYKDLWREFKIHPQVIKEHMRLMLADGRMDRSEMATISADEFLRRSRS